MIEYPSIPTVFKRDPETKHKTLLDGQYATPELEMLANIQWHWTEKVDGTNIRVHWNPLEQVERRVLFQERTNKSKRVPITILRMLRRKLSESRFKSADLNLPLTLYGEAYGLGIQKAGKLYKPDGQSFVLFDVRCGGLWLERQNVLDVALGLGLDTVPSRGYGTLTQMVERVQAGLKSSWGGFEAEGLVARPVYELQDRRGNRIITKVKAKDFKGSA